MLEIEVKILNQKHKYLEPKLLQLGAKKIFEGDLYAIHYGVEGKNNYLRLRKEGNKTILCYKNNVPDENMKICEETEVETSDFEKTKHIIESLGLKPYVTVKKYRVSYILDSVHFDFDKFQGEYEFIPEFLEIEFESEEKMNKIIEKLGFKKEDCLTFSGKDVIEFYKKK